MSDLISREERRMTDTFEFTLNNPLTEEQWDMITDVDFDRTDRITFHTKHGKEVEFAKVIRCKDCKYNSNTEGNYVLCDIITQMFGKTPDDNYCSWAERKQE